jgi:hypothetical protein
VKVAGLEDGISERDEVLLVQSSGRFVEYEE